MNKLTYITGGARSGKSTLATDIAKNCGIPVVFIATCQPKDKEMERRVIKHQNSRPKTWKTMVECSNLSDTLLKAPKGTGLIIIDCLTLYISNLLCSGKSESFIVSNIKRLVKTIKSIDKSVIIVSNEVGSGVVPINDMAREFRDIAGKANQLIAKASDEAYLMVSGLKVKLK